MTFDLNQTEDQRQILTAVKTLLNEHYPVSRLRDQKAPDDLTQIADFGAFSLALPEENGGTGFALIDEALLHVQLGRHLVSPNTIVSSIAARAAIDTGNTKILPSILDGSVTVCAGLLVGNDVLLIDGERANYAIVKRGADLQLIDIAALERHPVPAMGQGRPMHKIALKFGSAETGASMQTVHAEQVLVSAQLLGIAEGTLDMAVEYASTREQFGRPIGSFQAIKHHCANMAISAERLSAQLDMAALAVGEGDKHADFQVAVLSRIAPKIALENARICIQIHGGIGFSAEADAHLYLKQAHVLAQLCDTGDLLSLNAPMALTKKDT